MKALVFALVALAACSIDSRSDDFRCSNPGQCGAGRDCVDGWCVVDPSEIDASSQCPPSCTSCMDGTCLIECDGAGGCDAKVVCPGTMPCIVRCTGASACNGGVDCANASECEVVCGGTGSCDAQVRCGDNRCKVTCSGDGSCGDGIFCDDSCSCQTSCEGQGSCSGAIDCPGNCVQDGQCRTTPPGQCNNC